MLDWSERREIPERNADVVRAEPEDPLVRDHGAKPKHEGVGAQDKEQRTERVALEHAGAVEEAPDPEATHVDHSNGQVVHGVEEADNEVRLALGRENQEEPRVRHGDEGRAVVHRQPCGEETPRRAERGLNDVRV